MAITMSLKVVCPSGSWTPPVKSKFALEPQWNLLLELAQLRRRFGKYFKNVVYEISCFVFGRITNMFRSISLVLRFANHFTELFFRRKWVETTVFYTQHKVLEWFYKFIIYFANDKWSPVLHLDLICRRENVIFFQIEICSKLTTRCFLWLWI